MIQLDVDLFHLLNVTLAPEWLTPFMRFMTELRNFIPLIVILVAWMLVRGGSRGRFTVLALVLLIPATDQISSHVIKPAVGRPRPCHEESGLEEMVLRYGCGSGRSFPSSHATNIGGVAVLLALRYRRWAVPAAAIAFLVGYSRIFLGVHYPFDVLAGWLLGGLLGWLVWRLTGWGETRWRGWRQGRSAEAAG
jgi:undecaprenyl-diphosphatase